MALSSDVTSSGALLSRSAPMTVSPSSTVSLSPPLSSVSHQQQRLELSKVVSLVESNGLRFLILDCPSDERLPFYIEQFKMHNVTDVVRACESTYSCDLLRENYVACHDFNYPDGAAPSQAIIDAWLSLVDTKFPLDAPPTAAASAPCIAVHCVAGLGRAPVLVALALIERANMAPLDAIEFIRRRRRGAFNSKQIQFLDSYKRRKPRKNNNVGRSSMSATPAAQGTPTPPVTPQQRASSPPQQQPFWTRMFARTSSNRSSQRSQSTSSNPLSS